MTKTIAYVLYPELTALDLVGPLTVTSVLERLGSDWRTVTVARDLSAVDSDAAVGLRATATFDQVTDPDVVIVPGGSAGTFAACADQDLLGWLRAAAESAHLMASVCTGSLILGAAGLLRGRRATTHWSLLDALPRFGATPVSERWVRDGDVLTAAGVSAGIDMALHLVHELEGEEAARLAQLVIEYDPEPPLGPLDWAWTERSERPDLLRRHMHAALAEALGPAPETAD
ncbi:DJ-1/PfpI family protein [Nocardiopsis lucentensis]|uniref:DJ-1/PfpI family protein n=1 Tax=Nocardiopsis lucentensis TaxID=53441 RepID=UPI00034A3DCC|nr:DJ-1/PfpI family protein [Nocardiopsis lucentensis]